MELLLCVAILIGMIWLALVSESFRDAVLVFVCLGYVALRVAFVLGVIAAGLIAIIAIFLSMTEHKHEAALLPSAYAQPIAKLKRFRQVPGADGCPIDDCARPLPPPPPPPPKPRPAPSMFEGRWLGAPRHWSYPPFDHPFAYPADFDFVHLWRIA